LRGGLARDLGGPSGLNRPGEEELQESLVAKLVDLRRPRDPGLGSPPALSSELVDLALPGPLGGVASLDQPGLLQPLQLGVDLAVARGPEEAGRFVDQLLGLIAGPRPRCQHSDDHFARCAQLHGPNISIRYIPAM